MTKSSDKPLHIISLTVDNILRVVAVHITPNGETVELTGRNAQGKSSIIEALWMALGGETRSPDVPIHDGAVAGSVLVDLGNEDGIKFKVTLRYRKRDDGSLVRSLVVENEEGAKFSKPQDILNSLIGALSYDPLEFLAMKEREQFDLLRAFVPGYDFDAADEAHEKDFKERTDVNRDAKRLRSQEAGVVVNEDAPKERVDESGLIAELEAAGETNARVERARGTLAALATSIEHKRGAAADKMARAESLRAQADLLDGEAQEMEASVAEIEAKRSEASGLLEGPIDISPLRNAIEIARQVNAMFDKNERAKADRAMLAEEAKALEDRAEALTKSIEDRKKARMDAVAAAEMPVKGITFGDGVVLFNGLPISQASHAQKIDLSVDIAAALNPRLRLVTVGMAPMLDPEAWERLVAKAKEKKVQIIAETVRANSPTAVVIEDGRVAVKSAALQAAE